MPFTTETQIRVRYGETDQMGYVYYGKYAEYYEVARTEMIRSLGFTYRKMEDEGIQLPVIHFEIRYRRPAFYDDLLTVKTELRSMPGARITFYYQVYNEAKDLLNEGEVTLVFTNIQTRRPIHPPEQLVAALKPFFSPEV